eukprot:TRINITY_DN5555_c0_g1_i1.p1 TRINITY_DN5555_c0_g1~~TRINITY_DN5555_c0_g1_i1.p1  ORF type:complete len:221 (-),score=40.08 TRINITY_DN5555_c0_g1_i1:83-715(-)
MSVSGLRSTTTNWSTPFLISEQCAGDGLVIECTVKEVRAHSVFVRKTSTDQADNLPGRYNAFLVEVSQAYPRIFNSAGYEIDYQANIPSKKSYVAPKVIDSPALGEKLGKGSGSAMPKDFLPSTSHLFPTTPYFELWMDIGRPKSKDIEAGHELRVLTMGSSIFIDAVQILNAKGDALTGGWSSTIQGAVDEGEPLPGEDQEGCDSDEWD